MIRVVIDTNIIVSALLQQAGLPAQVLLLATGGLIQMCVSDNVYAEYEKVVPRPRFKRSAAEVEGALTSIRTNASWWKSSMKVEACSDPDDNIFLECAQAAKADYLITGNQRDFPNVWAGTRIVTAREFLNAIAYIQGP